MISMRRTLLPGMLAAMGLGSLWSSVGERGRSAALQYTCLLSPV